ncbi:hypothetical protein [Clostridium brassicae]|uniref:Uncharacterized protein n=1 Tax=Clostridium brassicae TaxID=2999072 RepID=A0ABT4DGT3_9CLOT|nr:hypothetical protein [Clostridium brassicae]MCY6960229.1 hypothetical protein [Clostridium brassicae]
MRVNRIIEINKNYEERERIEFKQKKQNDNNKDISFSEILKKKMYKNRA